MRETFEPGELFIYVNGSRYEIGKVKRVNNTGDGYFCWYHTGETAANTPVSCMHKLANAHVIDGESLGGFAGAELVEVDPEDEPCSDFKEG